MLAGEKSYGTNGKQNFLFPLEIMWLTQGSYSHTYSHNGAYAMDFQGAKKNSSGNVVREYNCPVYAPFDCHCVAKWGSHIMVVWQSDNEVNFVDGTTGYACIGLVHDDNAPNIQIGATRNQGDIIAHTGTQGASSDHIHIEAKKGIYNGYYENSQGVYMMRDSTWLYNLMGVNDTILYKDYYVNQQGTKVDYDWKEFSEVGPTPPTPVEVEKFKSDFPWVIYSRKFRDERRNI